MRFDMVHFLEMVGVFWFLQIAWKIAKKKFRFGLVQRHRIFLDSSSGTLCASIPCLYGEMEIKIYPSTEGEYWDGFAKVGIVWRTEKDCLVPMPKTAALLPNLARNYPWQIWRHPSAEEVIKEMKDWAEEEVKRVRREQEREEKKQRDAKERDLKAKEAMEKFVPSRSEVVNANGTLGASLAAQDGKASNVIELKPSSEPRK